MWTGLIEYRIGSWAVVNSTGNEFYRSECLSIRGIQSSPGIQALAKRHATEPQSRSYKLDIRDCSSWRYIDRGNLPKHVVGYPPRSTGGSRPTVE